MRRRPVISPDHFAMLAASGITPEHAALRGYETVTDKRRLAELKIVTAARSRVPGLLVPLLRADRSQWGYQYRPDAPRLRGGRPIKYETPWQPGNGLDIPPGVGPMLGDPEIPLWITEGTKKADCGALQGLAIVALSGVWNWLGTNTAGGKMVLADWRDVALNSRRVVIAFDGDIARKESVQKAAHALAAYLTFKGARVEFLHLPDTDDKTGLDDYLMAGHTVEDLWSLVKPHQPRVRGRPEEPPPSPEAPREPVVPVTLDRAHAVFHRWLGEDYETDALDAVLAAAAVEKLDDGSDPVWLLIISGPANAKTETVQALDGVGAVITSAITGDAALLSATPRRERTPDATGGLLRKIGERGLLVVKDVTSILSMNNDARAKVLAALREIYDGRWYREVGSDGGHTLEWRGRLVVVGAVTTAWDTHHGVVATMGDRFTLVRIDSTKARRASGRQAIANTGDEALMRGELSTAVAGVLAGMNHAPTTVTDTETERLLAAADLVTLARTGVEYDYRGDVIDAHAPEMPTRFAKQLTQIVRGAAAIGMDRADTLRLAVRCARDSMPPLRLALIDDLSAYPSSTPTVVRKRLGKPRATVDRQLKALHLLGVLTLVEVELFKGLAWQYSLADGIDPSALVVPPKALPEKSPHTPSPYETSERSEGEDREGEDRSGVCTDFSGNGSTSTGPPPPPPTAPRRPTVARPTSRGSARPVTSSPTEPVAPSARTASSPIGMS